MRKIHRINHRILATFLVAAIFLTSMVAASFSIPKVVAAEGDAVVRDDALHFIIRHWHTDYDEDANYQGSQKNDDDDDDNNYYVLLEGYIIPKTDEEKESTGDNFTIVLVDQESGSLKKASELYDENGKATTPYLGALNKRTGVLEIMVKPLRDKNAYSETGYDNLEKFAGFSMSAGRGAVSYVYDEHDDSGNGVAGTETGIRITYSEETHLVKGHFFYTSWSKTVPGTDDATVFDANEEEIDTADVYTWKETTDDHTAGSIVKYEDTENDKEVACKTEKALKKKAEIEGLNANELKSQVTLTKFYSTNEGMHTNKTLTQLDNGRLFLSDLEAWYVEGYAPQLGFILDASGGMAFPSDTPTIINVYSALLDQLNTLGVSKNDEGNYVYKGEVYDDPKTLFKHLEDLPGVGHTAIVSALSSVVVRDITEEDVHGLLDKIGELDRQKNSGTQFEYPQHDKLIGYYEFNNTSGQGEYAGYRTWGLNNIDARVAKSTEFQYKNFDESYFTKAVWRGQNGPFDFSDGQVMYNYDTIVTTYGLNFSGSNGFIPGNSPKAGILLNKTPDDSFTLSFSSDVNTTSNAAEILYIGPLKGEKSSAEFRMTSERGSFHIYSNGSELWSTNASDNTRFTLVYNGKSLAIYLGSVLSKTVNLSFSESNIVFAPFVDNFTSTNFYVDDIFLYDTALNRSKVAQLVTAHSSGKGINDTTTVLWSDVFIDDEALQLLLNPHNTVHTPLGVAAYNYYVDGGAPLGYWEGVKSDKNTVQSDAIVARTNGGNALGAMYKQGGKGWYFVTHGGGTISAINDLLGSVGTAKRFLGVSKGISVEDYIDGSDANTNVSYTVANQGPVPFYLDSQGNLRCFYSTSTSSGANSNACSYVYKLEDNQYVKTEALQRVLADFSTKLAEESPSSRISAVRFSTNQYEYVDGGLDNLVLLDWTDNPVEVAKMMSQVRGDGEARGTATGYDVSAAGINQYNYSLTGGTYVYTGLNAFYNKLIMDGDSNRRDDTDSPKYVVIFTDGADGGITSYNKNTGNVTIDNDTQKAVARVKDMGYTIVTVFTPDAGLTEGDEEYDKAKAFLTTIAGSPNADDGESFFFESTSLGELSEIFKNEILSQLTNNKTEGYTVQDYIDPRFDLENGDGTIWKLQANGLVKKIDPDGTTETIDVTQKNSKTDDYYTFHLSGESTPNARDPYLLFDSDKDMYYLKWVDQDIPSSAVGARDLLPVWNAEVLLRAKDDFIGGNAVLTGGNEENMNWVYHPLDSTDAAESAACEQELREEYGNKFDSYTDEEKFVRAERDAPAQVKNKKKWSDLTESEQAIVRETYIDKKMKKADNDASSGTNDMYKEYNKTVVDGKEVNDYDNPIDEYPSKGFPRTTANVQLLPINTEGISNVVYMGEAISPRQLLMEVEDDYITDSYYLDYLKRYAYQRYCNESDSANREEMNMPIWDLLADWLEIDNQEIYKKEFSVPYMYLPQVKFDDKTGKVDLNSTKENNTGGKDTHEKDVLGILTYRWEQLDPEPKTPNEPIKDYVKSNTNRAQYSLTVEYTPLRDGDTLAILNAAVPKSTAKTAEGEPIVVADLDEGQTISLVRDGIFADYVTINGADGDKASFEESSFTYNRETAVNDNLIKEVDKQTQQKVYQWDKTYKKAEGDEQPVYPDGSADGDESSYGSATFLNNGRTLTAFSTNTTEVVSGGISLELRVLIGELEEAAAKHNGEFIREFTLNAKRSFKDTDSIEKQKANGTLGDFGTDYTITFKFDYSADKISKLVADEKAKVEQGKSDGYVNIFAKSTWIVDTNATFTDTQTYSTAGKAISDYADNGTEGMKLKELPIGTYDFSLAEINKQLKSVLQDELHFAMIKSDPDNIYKDYFDESVLNGLSTLSEKLGSDGKPMTDSNGNVIYEEIPEINESNIDKFKAQASTNNEKTTVSFYVGTAAMDPDNPDDYVPTRGNKDEKLSDEEQYINNRLCNLLMASGNAKLTIAEKPAKSNESFLYRITGKTLGYKDVELIVSVNGSDSSTIDIPPGTYTVEEISDWSWKYDNKATYGKEDEEWTLYPNDLKKALTSLRYSDDLLKTHKTVTFEHEPNSEHWLGDENNKNNQFEPQTASTAPTETESPTE